MAEHYQRALKPEEMYGPFETYRWSPHAGPQWIRDNIKGRLRWRQYRGHPIAGSAHYGVIFADQIRYRAPMQQSLHDALDASDPLFRKNTDMLRFGSSYKVV